MNRNRPEGLRPYFDVVVTAFGTERLMLGSDWPVLALAGGYAKGIVAFRSLIAKLSQDEQKQIPAVAATRVCSQLLSTL